MGKQILSKAVQALQEAGFATERGYPGTDAAPIRQIAAAVNLHAADMRSKEVTLKVRILCPASLGAAACEDGALTAGQVLGDAGGKCTLGPCEFDSRLGLYCTELSALFPSQVPKITIGETALGHVLAFTSWRGLDEQTTSWADAKWNFRLEEYFPMGSEEEELPMGQFDLTHTCENGTENYLRATWTYQRRIWDASGIRQIRLGIANELETG